MEKLKEEVLRANLGLVEHGLVIFTWGNASAIDREKGLIVIKPSGVAYGEMKAGDMVVVGLDGKVAEGKLKPSSDTPTHIELYKAFKNIGGITHTHSTYATAWAQTGRDIPFYGTTHADYFYGPIPCARPLTRGEVERDYEKNTGMVIVGRFEGIDPLSVPAVLVKSHGAFSFGKDAFDAVHNAAVCEQVAKMAALTERIEPETKPADEYLMDKHYLRKHGKNAYYGQ
ncbi:MAG: L-ribulose-5-phosphate 4-epimerase [Clostridiales bacterium]|nr:L-ribulose-5-phosphate 4-epimerase [Clostridiales bacterium]